MAESPDQSRERQSFVRHELRAPLAVMYPALELLLSGQAGPLTSKQREYLDALERSVRRLDGAIASASATGWFDCAAGPLACEDLDAAALVREYAAARERLGERVPGLSIAAGLPRLRTDRWRLLQVLDALVDNAATHAGPKVAVRLEVAAASAATVEFTVRDDGPGIADDELVSVRGFGYVGERGRERERPGLGLGLWVAGELATQIGGELSLVSGPGAGLAATISLPAAAADPAEE
ncbi:MAG: HAMP domain-containing sensor histidine kinase [Thermoleophilia bacterium]|nr:HAMP domain-containing sensor histidine kinase [Thermoleophilia bacterium]